MAQRTRGPVPLLEPLADDRIVVELGSLEATASGREQAWSQAVTALAAGLSELDRAHDQQGVDWAGVAGQLPIPVLDGPGYRTVLAVQMDALARLLQAGDPISGTDSRVERLLVVHESRYWTRVANRFGVTVSPATRECLVATATLWGASDAAHAQQLLSAVLPGTGAEALTTIAEWLAALYHDGQRYWSGLQPDRLAEYLVGSVLSPPVRCPDVLTGAVTVVSHAQLEQALTVLGRAVSQHPGLSQPISDTIRAAGQAGGIAALGIATRLEHPQPMLAALRTLITTADIDTLHALSAGLPRHSMLLSLTSLSIAEALVARLRAAATTNRDAYLPDLAMSVNNLAVRLGEVGRRAEGLAAAQEAATLYGELAAENPDVFGPAAEDAQSLMSALGEDTP